MEDYAKLQGPTLLKETLGLQRRHHGLYVGSSGPIEPSLMGSNHAHANTSSIGPGPALTYDFTFLHISSSDLFAIHSDNGTLNFADEEADLDDIENHVAPNGRALINLYFRIIHPSFPILHKKVYLEKYDRSHREFSPALLAAVYVLAVNYWSYSQELSSSPAPDVKYLESKAMKCINDAIHRPKLSTVEAGLLLLQQGLRGSSAATIVPWRWSLTAQMIAAGQDLGLHRDCSTWAIPEWEQGLRKRLAWALYMQDKWSSLIQGRPSLIFEQRDWTVKDLIDHDFPENFVDENDEDGSTEVEKGKLIFTQMVSLTRILSDILSEMYCAAIEEEIAGNQGAETRLLLAKAKSMQLRLKVWYAQLPDHLDVDDIKFRKLSSNGYLHLAYWSTELTLHRRIIRTLPTCSDTDLVNICQKAASARSSSAMSFVGRLRPEHWQSFWYFASEYNFGFIGLFEALLASTLTSPKDISDSKDRLEGYQWTLKISQKTADFLQKSIVMIDIATKPPRIRGPPMKHSGSAGEGNQILTGSKLDDGSEDLDVMYDEAFRSLSPSQSWSVFPGETESIQSLENQRISDADFTNLLMS